MDVWGRLPGGSRAVLAASTRLTTRTWSGVALGSALALIPAAANADDIQLAAAESLERLSIEELANLEIMSVSRRPEPVSEAPAAIFVITNEDIRRAGARSIPEALRLAPNLQVARGDSGSYAITARGFNHSTLTANKLQVLIDGRSVYNPLYSGVFWDAQNVLLADIDRIEVISGPGGTLWGANAVNGVINIITRDASETSGTLVEAGAGTRNAQVALRHGGRLGADGAYRVYAMGFQRGPSDDAAGEEVSDQWDNGQAGFRADWSGARDGFTLQGDIFAGEPEAIPGEVRPTTINGGNLLGRWTRRFADDSVLEMQAYYDRSRRTVSSGILSEIDTYAAEGQYAFTRSGRHSVVLGGGVRLNEDHFAPGPGTAFLSPPDRSLRLGQAFVQDTYSATSDIDLTFGLKLEHNSYTGLEYMPNARAAWRLSDDALAWASVSRAVRTPARFDRDLITTGLLAGGPDFVSETLTAYEIGYRAQPIPAANFSVSLYYNDYDDLRSVEGQPPFVFPLVVSNQMSGETYGLEVWGDYALTDWWRLSAGANFLRKDLELDPGSHDVFGVQYAGNDPDYQYTARSLMNFSDDLELDLSVRAVDALPSPHVPAYTAFDARVGWRLTDEIELSFSGYNLFDDSHPEFRNSSTPLRQMPRSFFLTTRWRP
ncbi:MAG: TonB-dependent receptor [Terricaulis sp.]